MASWRCSAHQSRWRTTLLAPGLAALGIQEEAKRLAAGVRDRDGIDLRLRVGLDSGRVIAGEIGSGALGYTAIGEQVGMAQRMESVAPPGAVMLDVFTADCESHTSQVRRSMSVDLVGARLLWPRGESPSDRRRWWLRSSPRVASRTPALGTSQPASDSPAARFQLTLPDS